MQPLIIENNKVIDENDFLNIEKYYGCTLTQDIREFLEKYNGEIIEPEYGFKMTYKTFDNCSFSDAFHIIYHTEQIINQLQFIDYIEYFFNESKLTVNDVEVNKLMPIMESIGGSLCICIAICGLHKNKLYFVDNGDLGICKIDIKFSELIGKMKTTI